MDFHPLGFLAAATAAQPVKSDDTLHCLKMPRKRKKRKNSRKKSQKYIPIVVLNNRIPVPETTIAKPSIPRRMAQRPIRKINRRMGIADSYGARSQPVYSKMAYFSNSDEHGTCKNCSNSPSRPNNYGHISDIIIFLAALALAVAFLNSQITMMRRKRRKKSTNSDMGKSK